MSAIAPIRELEHVDEAIAGPVIGALRWTMACCAGEVVALVNCGAGHSMTVEIHMVRVDSARHRHAADGLVKVLARRWDRMTVDELSTQSMASPHEHSGQGRGGGAVNCQAHEMDVEHFGNPDDGTVPPCGGPRDQQRFGWWLCVGCAQALDGLAAAGRSLMGRDDQPPPGVWVPICWGFPGGRSHSLRR